MGRPIGMTAEEMRAELVRLGQQALKRAKLPHGYNAVIYPVTRRGGGKGTCDRPICERCAVRVGPDKDYCPAHSRISKETP